jgi:hypothetical protein
MLSSAAGKSAPFADARELTARDGGLARRKVWLPKLLYDALPWFYVGSGLMAFLATLYISEWFWIVPHYLLFSGACVHLGLSVYRRRHGAKDA